MAMIVGSAAAGTGMAGHVYAALQTDPTLKFTPGPTGEALADAIAKGVLEYILASAVLVPVLVAPPGGGPVTGTVGLT